MAIYKWELDTTMIIQEIKQIGFYNGNNIIQNCFTKNEYWLASSAPQYLKAEVQFFMENEEYTIKLFENSEKYLHKTISDRDAPKNGFYLKDLLQISECFKFNLLKDEVGNTKSSYLGSSLELIVSVQTKKTFFLIYSVNGGRAPESIYFFGLYEVCISDDFKVKYLSITA